MWLSALPGSANRIVRVTGMREGQKGGLGLEGTNVVLRGYTRLGEKKGSAVKWRSPFRLKFWNWIQSVGFHCAYMVLHFSMSPTSYCCWLWRYGHLVKTMLLAPPTDIPMLFLRDRTGVSSSRNVKGAGDLAIASTGRGEGRGSNATPFARRHLPPWTEHSPRHASLLNWTPDLWTPRDHER